MRRSTIIFLTIAAVLALLFIRLGFWQLGRRAERIALNETVAARLDSAVVGVDGVPADSGLARYRRVSLSGRYDYEHEVIVAGRTRNGSPGVNFFTPLRIAGRDTAVLVNRGWVYAPDAINVEAARWREPAERTLEGFVLPFPASLPGEAVLPQRERTLRHPDLPAMRALVPYPVASYYVVATDTIGFDIDSTPARLAPPPLDEGAHLGYAFQWFSFATIALAGAGVMVWNTRRGARTGGGPRPPDHPRA